jgi:hypothetical protein
MLFNVCVNMSMGGVHSRACTINELLFFVNRSPFFFKFEEKDNRYGYDQWVTLISLTCFFFSISKVD